MWLPSIAVDDSRLFGTVANDAEAPPIVGGKGLRQWQIAQRKAFLNGWSMMDRLTFLEYENARLIKENDLLRKVCMCVECSPMLRYPLT